MKVYEIDSARWAYKLAPQLTGRAQQAYAALNPDEAQSYDTVKAAILRRYNINEETYRKRFRSLKHKSGLAPTELVTRLTDLAGKWLKECSTADAVKDAVVKEQFMAALPEDVRVWVTERKPKTSAEAGQLAEDYLQARSLNTPAVRAKVRAERPPAHGAQNLATGRVTAQTARNLPLLGLTTPFLPLMPTPTSLGRVRNTATTLPGPPMSDRGSWTPSSVIIAARRVT